MGHLLEGSIALVEIEEIRGVEPADIDVQQSVVVHVDERRALFPDAGSRARVADPGLFGHIFEFPVAEVPEKTAAFGLAHDEYVGEAVAVIVSDGNPGADRSALEFLIEFAPHLGVGVAVFRPHTGRFRLELHKHGLPARKMVRRELLPGDAARGIGRPCGQTGEQESRQHAAADGVLSSDRRPGAPAILDG